MRKPLGAIILAVALSLGVYYQRSIHPPLVTERTVRSDDHDRYHDRPFRVVHVVDGDTVDIDEPDRGKPKTRIRLWGVDSPEVGHGRNADMHFGPEAKTFAEETLAGQTVWIVLAPNDTRDKFDRLLAYVFLERGGTMFNELLIEQGFAYADPRFHHPYDDAFTTIEKRAQRTKIGLWSAVPADQLPSWRQRAERP